MKAITSTLVVVFTSLLFSCISSKPAPKVVPKVIQESPRHRPLLWSIQKRNYPTSYLFGTIHLGVSIEDLDPMVWIAYRRSDQIVLEADISKADRSTFKKSVYLPEGKSMRLILGEVLWKKLLEKIPFVEPDTLNRMNALGIVSLLQGNSQKNLPSMDSQIYQRSLKTRKSIVFLESVDFQVNLLKKLITPDILKEYLGRGKSNDHAMLSRLSRTYMKGDVNSIYQLVVDGKHSGIKLSRGGVSQLIDERNKSWSTILEPIFRRASTFVAVGAGHYGGDQGLLRLLREKGFTVKRIYNSRSI